MSAKGAKSLAIVEKILGGQFNSAGGAKKLLAQKQEALAAAGIGSMVGSVASIGRAKDGTFRASHWPEWAYEPAKDYLLHGKKVWVIYEGDGPFGNNLLNVLILPYTKVLSILDYLINLFIRVHPVDLTQIEGNQVSVYHAWLDCG